MHIQKFIGAFLLILVTSLSCKNYCKKTDCGMGDCLEKSCACFSGWTGEHCDTPINARFEGKTYGGSEFCTAGEDQYEVSILVDTEDGTKISLRGLWGINEEVAAVVDGEGNITVEKQGFSNKEISATGSSDEFGDELTINYKVYYAGQGLPFDTCVLNLEVK